MDHITSFKLPPNEQTSSALFAKLPGEIRNAIFREALSSYEDKTRAYDQDTSYRRPNYEAPFNCDSALLQTCQRIYDEAWSQPWISRVHTFWLAWEDRRPDSAEDMEARFQTALQKVHDARGETYLEHVRVFSQLCKIGGLGGIISMKHFHPRTLTITIRHHDWWNWERDDRLRIEATCTSFEYPSSVTELRLELESLTRKKEQVDFVAGEMLKTWHFTRTDGVVLTGRPSATETSKWSGSSTWEDRRWIRDETEPETLHYYVKTVVWRPDRTVTAEELPTSEEIVVPEHFPVKRTNMPRCLDADLLRHVGVDRGSGKSAEEALRMVQNWQRRWHVADLTAVY